VGAGAGAGGGSAIGLVGGAGGAEDVVDGEGVVGGGAAAKAVEMVLELEQLDLLIEAVYVELLGLLAVVAVFVSSGDPNTNW
jgi:hypothetical protein